MRAEQTLVCKIPSRKIPYAMQELHAVLCHWTERLAPGASLAVINEIALALTGRCGPTHGPILEDLVKREDYRGLLGYELNQGTDEWRGQGLYHLISIRQVLGLYSKNPSILLDGVDPERAAYDKFLDSESLCAESNAVFRAVLERRAEMPPNRTRALWQARSFIKRVLGKAPSLGMLKLRFGPGATSTIPKKNAVPALKLAESPTCSRELLASGLLPTLFREMPGWLECHTTEDSEEVAVVDVTLTTASLQFVPKQATTHRSIDVQPTLNTLGQAAIGDYMFRLLKRAGLDLSDQSANQRQAQAGSLDGLTATLDLSSASDTISYWLVRLLLPDDWWRLLVAFRTGATSYGDATILLEKFCAMGNGYTFPLESLIFWALARTQVPHTYADLEWCRVYGDDIVVPTQWAPDVISLLEFCGFIVNTKKSYYGSEHFRESCGADYYCGINVRPYYCREAVSSRTLFTMHNFFWRNHDQELCDVIRRFIPKTIRLYGPDGYGDGHLCSNTWPSFTLAPERAKGYGGVSFRTYSLEKRTVLSPYYGDYISPLYAIYRRGDVDLAADPLQDPLPELEFLPNGRPLWPARLDQEEVAYKKATIYTFQRY